MKVVKLVLALLLAGGVVYAYLNFPNPMEQQSEAHAAEKAKAAEAKAAEEPAAPAGEST
jgi:hypothetical protein